MGNGIRETELGADLLTPKLQQVVMLLDYYFELGGYSAEELIVEWLSDYELNWLRLALIESLYQGRYKAVSIEQILTFWQRRGQPLFHFNLEFERLICQSFIQPELPALTIPPTTIGLDNYQLNDDRFLHSLNSDDDHLTEVEDFESDTETLPSPELISDQLELADYLEDHHQLDVIDLDSLKATLSHSNLGVNEVKEADSLTFSLPKKADECPPLLNPKLDPLIHTSFHVKLMAVAQSKTENNRTD